MTPGCDTSVDRTAGTRSGRDDVRLGGRKRARQLSAGPDPELGEHVLQVPPHGAWANEEPGADLRVRYPAARELSDLPFLGRQVVARHDGRLAEPLPRR